MNEIARWVSIIFHPFFMTTLTIYLSMVADNQTQRALNWSLLFILIVIIPSFVLLVVNVKRKVYTDFDITNKEQRKGYYIFCLVLTLIYFALLISYDAPTVIFQVIATSIFCLFSFFLVNLLWTKISIHTGIIFGSATFLYFYNPFIAAILFAVGILVSWSRYVLGRHTLGQVVLGLTVNLVLIPPFKYFVF